MSGPCWKEVLRGLLSTEISSLQDITNVLRSAPYCMCQPFVDFQPIFHQTRGRPLPPTPRCCCVQQASCCSTLCTKYNNGTTEGLRNARTNGFPLGYTSMCFDVSICGCTSPSVQRSDNPGCSLSVTSHRIRPRDGSASERKYQSRCASFCFSGRSA